MNLIWTAEEVLCAVRGRCLHTQDWVAHGVSIDSRTLQKNDLFVALKGPSCDGHAFVHAAFEAGACAAIVEQQPPQVPPDATLIFVDDSFAALQDLGRVGRSRAQGKIVGVTGSVGKTSTKEQIRLMLGAVDDTFANVGSLNNHWGVPLSLARLPREAKFGVFEMGMNHAGEMAQLTREVIPDVALISNVEAVHLEFFKTVEAIADAKAEIFLGMNPQGVAVLNRDSEHFARLLAAARTQGLKKVLSFGYHNKSDAQLLSASIDGAGTRVEATIFGKKKSFVIGAHGEHFAVNALGGLLVCAALDVDLDICMNALSSWRAPQGRGAAQTLNLKEGSSFTLIDQSFNASPVATIAAIKVLGQTPCEPPARRIAVLGDMRELGTTAPDLHKSLAASLCEENIDQVHCCGEMMAHLYNELPISMRGHLCDTSEDLAPLVAKNIENGDIIMVKGSKSMDMKKVIYALAALGNDDKQKIAS